MTDPVELAARLERNSKQAITRYCGDLSGAIVPHDLLTEAAACIREMVEFNVNNTVWIRVTQHGRKIEADHWASIGLTPPEPRCDAGGWEERQLWDVMNIFGGHMGLGLPVPFETTIRLAPPAPGAEA